MKRMSQNFPNGGAMDTHFANMRSLIQVSRVESSLEEDEAVAEAENWLDATVQGRSSRDRVPSQLVLQSWGGQALFYTAPNWSPASQGRVVLSQGRAGIRAGQLVLTWQTKQSPRLLPSVPQLHSVMTPMCGSVPLQLKSVRNSKIQSSLLLEEKTLVFLAQT